MLLLQTGGTDNLLLQGGDDLLLQADGGGGDQSIPISDTGSGAEAVSIAAVVNGGGILPTAVTGLRLWVDGADIGALFQDAARTTPVAADNDPVGGVADKSGEANHAAQSTAAARPLYKTNIQKGKPALLFDGANDALSVADVAALDLNADSTVFVVIKGMTAEANAAILSKADGANPAAYALISDADGKLQVDRPFVEAGAPTTLAVATNTYVVAVRVRGTAVAHFLNGAANGTDTLAAGTATATALVIGAFGASTFLSFYLCELLVYDRALSDGVRELLEDYLNEKWAVYDGGHSDTGSATDSVSLTAAVTPADTGTGVEGAPTITVAAPLADAGAGAEASLVTVPIGLADTGSGADAVVVTFSISVGDAGSGVDVVGSIVVLATLGDVGAGVDVPLTETGTDAPYGLRFGIAARPAFSIDDGKVRLRQSPRVFGIR